MSGDALHIVKKIINEYSSSRHPAELEKEVMDWLAGDRYVEEKDIAIQEIFYNIVTETGSLENAAQIPLDDLWKRISHREKPLLKRRFNFLGVAAVLLPFLLFIGTLFYWTRDNTHEVTPEQTDYITLSVQDKDQDYLLLPDGSEVWINGSSEIRYSEDFARERIVYLNGEAFFSVDANSPVPFRVISKNITVTVKGTRFNVDAYDDSDYTKVVLIEGEVEVTKNGAALEPDEREVITISPNEQVVMDNASYEIEVSTIDNEDIPLWRNMVVFNNTPMEDVLKVVAARAGYIVRFEGSLPKDGITVSFSAGADIETVMYVIRQTSLNFDYELQGHEIVIYPR